MLSFDDPDPNKARANRKNHEGVTFEAKTVFDDAQNLTVSDFESDPDDHAFGSLKRQTAQYPQSPALDYGSNLP